MFILGERAVTRRVQLQGILTLRPKQCQIWARTCRRWVFHYILLGRHCQMILIPTCTLWGGSRSVAREDCRGRKVHQTSVRIGAVLRNGVWKRFTAVEQQRIKLPVLLAAEFPQQELVNVHTSHYICAFLTFSHALTFYCGVGREDSIFDASLFLDCVRGCSSWTY